MNFIDQLFSGSRLSDCLKPCLITRATVEEGIELDYHGVSSVWLTFHQEVQVKKTSVDRFSLMDSLNYLGSNLGLWPGMGLYQVLESLLGLVIVNRVISQISSRIRLLK